MCTCSSTKPCLLTYQMKLISTLLAMQCNVTRKSNLVNINDFHKFRTNIKQPFNSKYFLVLVCIKLNGKWIRFVIEEGIANQCTKQISRGHQKSLRLYLCDYGNRKAFSSSHCSGSSGQAVLWQTSGSPLVGKIFLARHLGPPSFLPQFEPSPTGPLHFTFNKSRRSAMTPVCSLTPLVLSDVC